jgi:hypothetical protein
MSEKPEKILTKIDVVLERNGKSIRCIYLNDRRIAGAKPYASENLKWLSISGDEAETFIALGI